MTRNDEQSRLFIEECENRYRTQVKRCAEAVSSKIGLRYIALCGPTCSGKTTTAEILISELKRYGFDATVISVDHFFRSRADIIAEGKKNGTPPDMDSVKAIDLDAFKDFLNGIEAGQRTFLPYYDFTLGEKNGGEYIEPKDNGLYIIEGIQAFYPEILSLFDREKLLCVFISVEDEVENEGGVLSARDQRLLRRTLRDSKFRGTDAESTFAHWDEVVKNELLHIDPYKSIADIVIDSTMPYEGAVMKTELLELLSSLPEGKKRNRLINYLLHVTEIDRALVPTDSVIREFIG